MTSSTYFATRQRQPSASTRAFYRKLKLENNLHFLISGETPPSSSAAASQNRSDSICQRQSWRTSADRLEEGAAENVCLIVWCDVTNFFFFFNFIIRKRSVAGVLFCHLSLCAWVCAGVISPRSSWIRAGLDALEPVFFFFLSVCCHSSPCHHGNN